MCEVVEICCFVCVKNKKKQDMIMSDCIESVEIQMFLFYCYLFLLVDVVEDYVKGEFIIGIKGVMFNELFFLGYFFGNLVMLGVLMIEVMGQIGVVLMYKILGVLVVDVMIFFMGVDKVKF